MINREIIQRVAEENLEYKLSKLLDSNEYDANAIPLMFKIITLIYKWVSPETLQYKLRIALAPKSLDRGIYKLTTLEDALTSYKKDKILLTFDEFTFSVLDVDCSGSNEYFQYLYNSSRNEQFVARHMLVNVPPSADNVASSIFAIPTYKELDESFEVYYQYCARYSQCYILKQIWEDNTFSSFVNKPENFMQQSLYQYLHTTLRSHTVSREKIVDDSHPVDIEVIWPTGTTVALVEIKWLGISGTTKYTNSRANKGAKQLIEYLDASKRKEAKQCFKGYLVVYDGRRHQTKSDHYRNKDISYKNEYLMDERMFYKRLYLEQKCAILS